jgi:putative hemolysin
MRKLIVSLGVVGIMLAGTAGPALAANPHKKDHGERLCKKEGGAFVRVDNLVYACVLPTGATEKEIRQAARECKKHGGALFAAVGNVVYACVLPGGTLPGSITDPVTGLPLDTSGLRLFPIVLV